MLSCLYVDTSMMFTEAPESIMTSIRCSLTHTWHLGGWVLLFELFFKVKM